MAIQTVSHAPVYLHKSREARPETMVHGFSAVSKYTKEGRKESADCPTPPHL